jgi:microcystin-dependent protein
MALSDYSTTASSNGNVLTGIDIAENCLPSNLNNAQRQVMADLATDLARANGSQEGLATGVSFAMPRGSIIMWSNTAGGTVPVGWALCDGTNGTPNLANKFIRSEATEASGGGADSVTLAEANIPQHSHDSGTLTGSAASAGDHSHTVADSYVVTSPSTGGDRAYTGFSSNATTTRTTSTAGAHTHTVSITGGTTGSYGSATPTAIDNRPAYYALAFIMKL